LTTHLRFYYMTNASHLDAAVNAKPGGPSLVLGMMISANRYKKPQKFGGLACSATAGPGA
jgi:hypothetical protein